MENYGQPMNLNREPVPVPPERDWPSMGEVQKQFPELCGEEQEWVLEALLTEAHRIKRGEATK